MEVGGEGRGVEVEVEVEVGGCGVGCVVFVRVGAIEKLKSRQNQEK